MNWIALKANESLVQLDGQGCCPVNCITEVRDLEHLDHLIEAAGSSVMVLALYSRVSGCPLQQGSCLRKLKHLGAPYSAKPLQHQTGFTCKSNCSADLVMAMAEDLLHWLSPVKQQVSLLLSCSCVYMRTDAASGGVSADMAQGMLVQSCGACKDMLRFQQQLCKEVGGNVEMPECCSMSHS